MLSRSLSHCVYRVGLSWRSLSAALGEKTDPTKWAVLYLGTAKTARDIPEGEGLYIVDRHGKPVPTQAIEGLVLLDGNWKQSKSMWWRNPWLLKLNRAILNPDRASQYTSLRRQPRKQCLSTAEAAAQALRLLEGNEPAANQVLTAFREFVSTTASND